MSLNYSLANVATLSVINDEETAKHLLSTMSHELESIVFHMMFVGVSKLDTRIACETFYTRYNAYNMSLGRELKNNFLKYSDVEFFMGLTTNASTKTDAAFKKECTERMMQWAWDSFSDQRAEQGNY